MSKKWDKIFKQPLSCFISAPRQSGKTTLVKKIIENTGKNYDIIGIYTNTGRMDDTWKDVEKKRNVILDSEFDKAKIEQLLDFVKPHVESGGKRLKVLLVLDDLTNEYSTGRKDILNKLAFCSRHYGISYIFTSHRYMSMSPLIRENSLTCVFYSPATQQEVKKIGEDFTTRTSSSDDIVEMVEGLERYHALVVTKGGTQDEYHII